MKVERYRKEKNENGMKEEVKKSEAPEKVSLSSRRF
jgi:hypothetical protein